MVKKKSYLFFSIIIIIVVLDQLTKFIVKNNFKYTTNTGSLWGLFPNSAMILVWLSIIIIGIFLFYYDKIQSSNKLCKIGSGLIVGGAIGNLIDRLLYKAVIDFIDLKVWPSFNIADSAISIGVILLIYYFVKEDKK